MNEMHPPTEDDTQLIRLQTDHSYLVTSNKEIPDFQSQHRINSLNQDVKDCLVKSKMNSLISPESESNFPASTVDIRLRVNPQGTNEIFSRDKPNMNREFELRSRGESLQGASRTSSPFYEIKNTGQHFPSQNFLEFLSRKADKWKAGPLTRNKSQETRRRLDLDGQTDENSSQVVINTKDGDSIEAKHTDDPKNLNQILKEESSIHHKSDSKHLQVQQLFSFNFEPLRKRSSTDFRDTQQNKPETENTGEPNCKLFIQRRQNSAPSINAMIVKTKKTSLKFKSGSFAPGMTPEFGANLSKPVYTAAMTDRDRPKQNMAGCLLHQATPHKKKHMDALPYQQEIKESVKIKSILAKPANIETRFKPTIPFPNEKRKPIQAFSNPTFKQNKTSKAQEDRIDIGKLLRSCFKTSRDQKTSKPHKNLKSLKQFACIK